MNTSRRTRFVSLLVLALMAFGSSCQLIALDIGAMTWTQRSDWLNVKTCSTITGGPNATGNGTTDDTVAIQKAIDYCVSHYGQYSVYFPSGTYKITQTLKIWNVSGMGLFGCGSNTKIVWGGVTGGAMCWCNTTDNMRYIGLTWNGNSTAGCAYEENNSSGGYGTDQRHENESFKNFTATGTYNYTGVDGNPVSTTAPGVAIIGALQDAQVTGEFMIYNCAFSNCTVGVQAAYQTFQNYVWTIDGCEFETCGTAVNFGQGGCFVVANTHFLNSTTLDISGGFAIRIRHCTSTGGNMFYNEGHDGSLSEDIIQDCWIDTWKNTSGAVAFGTYGVNTVFDCKFTNPPAGATSAILEYQNYARSIFSNNYAPNFPGGVSISSGTYQGDYQLVPPGQGEGVLTSPKQTFLRTATIADSTHILDVTKAPYNAKKDLTADATSAIQQAINAANSANNGSIVYIPHGLYKITSTLDVSGGNYTLQGAGVGAELCNYAGGDTTLLDVADPQGISIKALRLANLSNIPGSNQYQSQYPTADPLDAYAIHQTGTGSSNVTYDDIYDNIFYAGNPGAGAIDDDDPGLVLDNLPAGSVVFMPHVTTSLTIENCGAAQIFARYLQNFNVHISGTAPKTGYFGALVAEGGQQEVGGTSITVKDNQNLTFGDYYSEQSEEDLNMQGETGVSPGLVAIGGFQDSIGNNNGSGANANSITINNYVGQLFYQSSLSNYQNSPVTISQTGSNPITMDLVADVFNGTGAPVISVASGANLIQLSNEYFNGSTITYLPNKPNPLTAAAYQTIAQGYDAFRTLENEDLTFDYGVQEVVTNTSAELDTANPSPLSTAGYQPAGWQVSNAGVVGSGVRNFTVVIGASPFAAGNQSMLWEDTTSSPTGSKIGAGQNFAASPGNLPALESFDFRCNPTGTHSDLWLFTTNGPGVHITSNGSSVNFGANVGTAGDTTLTTLTAGIWYHVQIVLAAPSAGTSNATLYLTPWKGNGPTSTTSYTIAGVQAASSSGFGGLTLYDGSGPGDAASINLDNVSLTTKAPEYSPTATGTQSGMVAHWTLDESTGGLSYDSAGGLTGYWQNGPAFTTDHPSAITFSDPGSLTFNGTNQSVFMGSSWTLPSGKAARSICGWAKAASTAAGYRWIAAFGSPGTSQAMFIGMNGTTLYGGGYADDLSVANFWDANWHFIALTYDGTTAKLYADGKLVSSGAKNWNLVPYECYIGEQVNNGPEYWNGSVDDVRIYNRALSASDISALQAGGK